MRRLLITFFLVVLTASLTWGAKGPSKVSNGPHNLSTTGTDSFYRSDEDQLCVFCHTPHGGTLDGPLWNRNSPPNLTGWNHYNSATLSTSLKALDAARPPNPESMLCLSCHDGSLSINHVINEPNDRTTPIETDDFNQTDTRIQGIFSYPGARIGGEPGSTASARLSGRFTDDHPFSFSYTDVLASAEYQPSGAKKDTLHTPEDAVNAGVRFFAGIDNKTYVECSSCHDPHVDYKNPAYEDYTPFLITPNTGSDLCLACHIK